MIDDVAVYNKAMSNAEIQAVVAGAISGSHPNLIAGYKFDTYTGVFLSMLPAKLSRPISVNSRAFQVDVPSRSNTNSALFDNLILMSPSAVDRQLPFPVGQVWRVIQQFDEKGGSHNGTAAFSWDFQRVDAATKGFLYRLRYFRIPVTGCSNQTPHIPRPGYPSARARVSTELHCRSANHPERLYQLPGVQ